MRAVFKTVGRCVPILLPTVVFCDQSKAETAAPKVAPIVASAKVAAVSIDSSKKVNIPAPVPVKEAAPEAEVPVDAAPPEAAVAVVHDEAAEDAEWEEKKKHCSFCKHFLNSPCKMQFKGWSKCVEKCKEEDIDFVEHCGAHTKALVHCTSSYPEYFIDPEDRDDDDEEDTSKQGESVAAEDKEVSVKS
jgi:hypothetical protein